MNVKDKIAVVTGVSRGIGLATVEALLAQGMKVAGWGRTAPEVQHEDFEFVNCDVRRADSVQMAYKQTVEHFGGHIAVLVNNAGLGRSAKLEDQAWKTGT
jgi:NAD(P)-dependent dehydrogenase (short-subunit alcohol dehydrogenase family)